MTLLQLFRKKKLPMKQPLCIWGISQVPLEYFTSTLPAKWAEFQFLKVKQWQFSKASYLPLPHPSQLKTLFSEKSQPKLKGFHI